MNWKKEKARLAAMTEEQRAFLQEMREHLEKEYERADAIAAPLFAAQWIAAQATETKDPTPEVEERVWHAHPPATEYDAKEWRRAARSEGTNWLMYSAEEVLLEGPLAKIAYRPMTGPDWWTYLEKHDDHDEREFVESMRNQFCNHITHERIVDGKTDVEEILENAEERDDLHMQAICRIVLGTGTGLYESPDGGFYFYHQDVAEHVPWDGSLLWPKEREKPYRENDWLVHLEMDQYEAQQVLDYGELLKERKHPEMPTVPYYVTATDTSMSGWKHSGGLSHRLIFPCESMEEVKVVTENVKSKADMIRIKVCYSKPRRRKGILYPAVNRKVCDRWYREVNP